VLWIVIKPTSRAAGGAVAGPRRRRGRGRPRLPSVRRSAGLAIAAVLAVGASACGASGRTDPAAATPSIARSTGSPSPSVPSPSPVALVPKPYNVGGYPPCGFFTSVQDQNGQKIKSLELGVAVGPSPTAIDPGHPYVTVRYEFSEPVPGTGAVKPVDVQFDRGGRVANGSYFTPPGGSFAYVAMRLTIFLGIDTMDYPFKAEWDAWFGHSHTVTVTVDPNNEISKSTQGSTTLKLQVKTTNRKDIQVTDNTCKVV
jgi:hypothetical protein